MIEEFLCYLHANAKRCQVRGERAAQIVERVLAAEARNRRLLQRIEPSHVVESVDVIGTYKENIEASLNFGVKESAGPAAVPLEHAEWVTDRLNDGVTVTQDQIQDQQQQTGNGQ